MYFDAPMREGVRLSEAGAEAARAGTNRVRRNLVVRDRPRSFLSAAPGGARNRAAANRHEHRGGVRPHPVLDGDQCLGSAVGKRRSADARLGNPGEAPCRAPVLGPSSTTPPPGSSDYIDCLRAIWSTFQTGARPRYEGRFYRFTLINDFFNPGPIDNPDIPVYLAGVNPRMAAAAGEAADGFSVHPMHSPDYLREVVHPALAEGARKRDRSAQAIALVASCFVVRGATESERSRSERAVRRQIAFYASTPSYRTFLEFHGEMDAAKAALRAHARRPVRRDAESRERCTARCRRDLRSRR